MHHKLINYNSWDCIAHPCISHVAPGYESHYLVLFMMQVPPTTFCFRFSVSNWCQFCHVAGLCLAPCYFSFSFVKRVWGGSASPFVQWLVEFGEVSEFEWELECRFSERPSSHAEDLYLSSIQIHAHSFSHSSHYIPLRRYPSSRNKSVRTRMQLNLSRYIAIVTLKFVKTLIVI